MYSMTWSGGDYSLPERETDRDTDRQRQSLVKVWQN